MSTAQFEVCYCKQLLIKCECVCLTQKCKITKNDVWFARFNFSLNANCVSIVFACEYYMCAFEKERKE